jgi:hypothetical protein
VKSSTRPNRSSRAWDRRPAGTARRLVETDEERPNELRDARAAIKKKESMCPLESRAKFTMKYQSPIKTKEKKDAVLRAHKATSTTAVLGETIKGVVEITTRNAIMPQGTMQAIQSIDATAHASPGTARGPTTYVAF